MIRVRAAAMLVIAACSGSSTKPPPPVAPFEPTGSDEPLAPARELAPAPVTAPPPSGPGVKVTLGDVGLEAASLDRTADPCIDFYQYACGGWLQANPIPPERARWSRLAELEDRNAAAIKTILDDAAAGTTSDPASKQLGAFYASCTDQAAIDRAGTAAFRTVLARTQGVKDAASWLAAVVELHKLGIFAVWDHRVRADRKSSSTNVTYLDAAGLTLPGRAYYLDAAHQDTLARYQLHVGKLLALLPAPPAGDAAADVVAIETELAKLTRPAAEARDVVATYQPSDLKALARQARSVDWPRYFQALGGAPSKRIIVGTPALFAGLDKLRARFKPAQWASYFTFQLVEGLAFALPAAFDAEAFELQKLVTGVEHPRDRGQRCLDITAGALGELLAQPYVARYFPGSSKQDATKLVDAMVTAMAASLASAGWLSDATRQLAIAKLGKLGRTVGFPDRWRTYDAEIKRDDFAGNVLRAAASETRRQLARAGKPVDRGEWQMTAFAVGAHYHASANQLAVTAGTLQRPLFAADRAVAANLGGIALMIGHELTHGFDDRGAQVDADGNLKTWWQPDELARFADKAACVADQYATFEALPKQRIDGRATLAENIADLGGARLAFQAYRALRKDAAKTYVADGLSEDQQFFLAVGQATCARDRPAEAERRLRGDPFAPPKFRVYGALRNMTEFADAFRCAAGTPMRPARSCAVW